MPKPKEVTGSADPLQASVRRIHRRDLNRTWDFIKDVFRDVNRETVEKLNAESELLPPRKLPSKKRKRVAAR
jgi:hypothetical protein